MYCSICGFKINDGAVFCTNCGSKVETESTASSTSKTIPIDETKQVINEIPLTEAPVTTVQEVKVTEAPVDEVKVTEVPVALSAPVEEVKVTEAPAAPVEEIKVVNANGPIIENPTEENIKKTKTKKKKKKSKTKKVILIILLILLGLFILFVVFPVLCFVIFSICAGGGYTLAFLFSDYDAKPGTDTTYLETISDYYGDYHGTSKIISTFNSEDLSNYMQSIGNDIDEELLHTDLSEQEFAISIYDDAYSDASWDMMVYLGDYFGYQRINNLSFVASDDMDDSYFVFGDMNIKDEDGSFYIGVNDEDNSGWFEENMIKADSDDTCTYNMKFYGDADGNSIDGTLKITFIYDGMENPFSEIIEIHAEK